MKQFSKNILNISLLLLLILSFGYVLNSSTPEIVRAGAGQNVSGWAWSDNIGWISFNCTDQGTCGASNYGVAVDSGTGDFSGYAWSDNVGWVNFAPVGSYPEAPSHVARLESDDTVTGWARVCAGAADVVNCSGGANPTAGGWDGWIKLSGDWDGDGTTEFSDGPDDVDGGTGDDPVRLINGTQFEGYAWGGNDGGSNVVGWIDFNPAVGVGVIMENPNDPPVAIIDSPASNKTIVTGSTVDFLGHGTDTDGPDPSVFEWSSTSCGGSVTNTNASFTSSSYNTTGTYQMYFRVQDDDGAWSTSCKQRTITVTDCGNGVIDPGEQCDGVDLNGQECTDRGYGAGTLSCTSSCTFDESACTVGECGDGIDNDVDGFCDVAGGTCTDGSTPGDSVCTDPTDPEGSCGDTVCKKAAGENFLTCRVDCPINFFEF